MKKSVYKIVTLVAVLFAFTSASAQQAFEGIIEFKKQSATDTTSYVYHVKDNKVRIDEIGTKSRKIEGSFLVDLEAKTMKSLNHERKLYMDQNTPAAPVVAGTCEVTKTKNTKTIQGFPCTEYIVKNTTEGVQISYWVAEGKFPFFEKLLRQLNRKDKFSTYFLKITDIKNSFTMLAVQKTLDGKETGRLEVTKITKRAIEPAMFEIPRGYNKFEK